METQQDGRTRSSRNARNSTATPVRRRSLRHILQPPPEQSSTVFDPSDPYSSAMDNVPLKDLFPNMKVKKRPPSHSPARQTRPLRPVIQALPAPQATLAPQAPPVPQAVPLPTLPAPQYTQVRKAETSEVPSPKGVETDDSVRCKLRDSLTAALRIADNLDSDRDQSGDVKMENQAADANMENQAANPNMENQAADPNMENQAANVDVNMENQAVDVKIENQSANVNLENQAGDASNGLLQPLEVLQNKTGTEVVGLDHPADQSVFDSGVIPNKVEDESGFLEQGNVDGTEHSSLSCKRPKLVTDCTYQNQSSSDIADKLALDIETELYRHFGGVNRKYKEKARSLLFNLKDRNNPELRSRVLSGEITPENLCNMNAEQLASKELSEWRMAKAEELAHMIVFTNPDADQPRLVKKTHKGEVEVTVERDDVLPEVGTIEPQQRPKLINKQETEETVPDIAAEQMPSNNEDGGTFAEVDMEKKQLSPVRELLDLASGISANGVNEKPAGADFCEVEGGSCLQEENDANLPTILSLDEYMGSKKENQPRTVIKGDGLDLKLGCSEVKADESMSQVNYPLNTLKDKAPRKAVAVPSPKPLDSGSIKNVSTSQKDSKKDHKVNQKLWEGTFQLSGSQISPVLAIYKSGDAIELQSWPKQIEIKGRVRLDALDKFLQELRLSRTRAIMIIACQVDGGQTNIASVNALKEASYQYNKGERVGYAEPLPGYELYLFPGGGDSLKMLVGHGYLNSDQILEEEMGILIGFIVCRRSLIPINNPKSSSQYFNANRHALSAQLDSPTRPNESQWSGNMVPSSKSPFISQHENKKAPGSFVNLQKDSSVESGLRMNRSMPSVPEKSFQDRRSGGKLKADEEYNDDLPPGFGPKPGKRSFEDDDDDLPEYDFSSQKLLPNSRSAKLPEGSQLYELQGTPLRSSVIELPQASQASSSRISSSPETSHPFDQFNSGPQIGRVSPSLPLSTPVNQPLQFLAAGGRPPPGPPPGQPSFSNFPPRSDVVKDVSHPGRALAPHGETHDAFGVNLNPSTENKLIIPRPENIQDQRAQSHPVSVSNAFKGAGHNGGINQASSLWDDDDMPEWCPPTITQSESRQVPPCPPVLSSHEPLLPRGMVLPPHIRGWSRMPSPQMPSLPPPPQLPPGSLAGRGIPPAIRYPGPSGRGMFPIAQIPPYRNQNIRPHESHSFRNSK